MDDVYQQLDREWTWLATASRARRRCAAWAGEAPGLARFGGLDDLVSYCQRRGNPGASDTVLAPLARIAAFDPLAGRTVLQALLPGLKALTHQHGWAGPYDEIAGDVVGFAWERIRTYPVARRPSRVAANIILDTRRQLRRSFHLEDTVDVDELPERAAPDDPNASQQLLALLRTARQESGLDAYAEALLRGQAINDVAFDELARRSGTPERSLRRHHQRAVARLQRAAL